MREIMTDKQNSKDDDDDFDFIEINDFDFGDEVAAVTEQDIKAANNMRENIKKQNTISEKISASELILTHISGSDLNNGYTDQLDRTDAFVSLIELLDKEKVFKLPGGVYYFAYEMVNGPKKDKAKFLLWAQHKILTSSEINDKVKVEILKIFNTASALTVFGNMEWQIATV